MLGQYHSMWHFLFSRCNPVTIFWTLTLLKSWGIVELRLVPYVGPWGKVNFANVEVVIRHVTALMHTVYVHKAVSDFPWYRNIIWRQPCETGSAWLATIFALKPLGHERLRVKSFVTWISVRFLDAPKFGVLPIVLHSFSIFISSCSWAPQAQRSTGTQMNCLSLSQRIGLTRKQQLSVTGARKTNSFYFTSKHVPPSQGTAIRWVLQQALGMGAS